MADQQQQQQEQIQDLKLPKEFMDMLDGCDGMSVERCREKYSCEMVYQVLVLMTAFFSTLGQLLEFIPLIGNVIGMVRGIINLIQTAPIISQIYNAIETLTSLCCFGCSIPSAVYRIRGYKNDELVFTLIGEEISSFWARFFQCIDRRGKNVRFRMAKSKEDLMVMRLGGPFSCVNSPLYRKATMYNKENEQVMKAVQPSWCEKQKMCKPNTFFKVKALNTADVRFYTSGYCPINCSEKYNVTDTLAWNFGETQNTAFVVNPPLEIKRTIMKAFSEAVDLDGIAAVLTEGPVGEVLEVLEDVKVDTGVEINNKDEVVAAFISVAEKCLKPLNVYNITMKENHSGVEKAKLIMGLVFYDFHVLGAATQ